MSKQIFYSPYVTCPSCNGSGMQDGFGEVTECWECHGDTTVRARDERGRFVTFPFEAEVVDVDKTVEVNAKTKPKGELAP